MNRPRPSLRILFLVSSHNGLSQRALVSLTELGHEVMGCDRDAAVVAAMAPRLTQALQLDATDADAIAEVGPAEFDVVVVALDPAATILATMLLTRMMC